jgi:tetratricopeptide (TPR) repeat protein
MLSEPAKARGAPAVADLWEARLAVLYSYGTLLASIGDLDGALTHLGRQGEWMCDSRNPQRAGHFYTAAANVHLKKGMIDECLDDYRRAIEVTRTNHLAPQLGQALQGYGDTLIALGREREALPALDEAARVYDKLADRPAETLTWAQMARVHERLDNVRDAQSAWERALRLYRQVGNVRGEIDALEGLGRVARRHLPSVVALRFYEDAIARATTLADDQSAARLHNSAGIIEWTRAQYENALAHFEHALNLFETIGDVMAAGQMMNSIGVSLSALGRTADARERLRQALVHHERVTQPQLEAHAMAGLGDLYWDTGEHTEAATWYERSLRKRTAIDDRRGEGWMLQRLARAKVAVGDREDVDRLLARATGISMQCSDEELMEECLRLRRTIERFPAAEPRASATPDV